ncbi:MAG: SDR family oxidoreductase [bacterium]|nr:SDR family oxidoreductase [bacterium]
MPPRRRPTNRARQPTPRWLLPRRPFCRRGPRRNPEIGPWVRSRIPMGRLGTTEDLVGPAIYLASAASDYMTGQTVFVDGGFKAG